MSTTDTPRTDAEAVLASTGFGVDDYCEKYVPAEFARTLERQNRELAEALTRIQHISEKEDGAPVIMKGRRLMIHDIATKALLGDDPS